MRGRPLWAAVQDQSEWGGLDQREEAERDSESLSIWRECEGLIKVRRTYRHSHCSSFYTYKHVYCVSELLWQPYWKLMDDHELIMTLC